MSSKGEIIKWRLRVLFRLLETVFLKLDRTSSVSKMPVIPLRKFSVERRHLHLGRANEHVSQKKLGLA
jgi:hypothetical protein